MKRTFTALVFLCILLSTSMAFGVAGTVTSSWTHEPSGIVKVTFICTGGTLGDAGTVPNTAFPTDAINFLTRNPHYLYRVVAYPTVGGTAPDAADVFILDASGLDLLGCIDGSTTAYNGLNIIHATLTRTCLPNMYIQGTGAHANYYPEITGALTLKVANQATASANWTIESIFIGGE